MSVHTNPAMIDALLCPNQDVICQRMREGIVLLNLRTDRFYELNPTAARLWELLSEKSDAALIQETLLNEFDVDPGRLANEISALISSLKQEGLIVDSECPPNQEGER